MATGAMEWSDGAWGASPSLTPHSLDQTSKTDRLTSCAGIHHNRYSLELSLFGLQGRANSNNDEKYVKELNVLFGQFAPKQLAKQFPADNSTLDLFGILWIKLVLMMHRA